MKLTPIFAIALLFAFGAAAQASCEKYQLANKEFQVLCDGVPIRGDGAGDSLLTSDQAEKVWSRETAREQGESNLLKQQMENYRAEKEQRELQDSQVSAPISY